MKYEIVYDLVKKYVDTYNKDPDSENSWGEYYGLYYYLRTEFEDETAYSIVDSIKANKYNKMNFNKNLMIVNKEIMESLKWKIEMPLEEI